MVKVLFAVLLSVPMIVVMPLPAVAELRIFFFNDTATTEIYTLSLHDALPIYPVGGAIAQDGLHDAEIVQAGDGRRPRLGADRKSTRLNSSHSQMSYAVFCLEKKMLVA